ncbi:MAG: pyridoxal-dependent decarboxylase [Actinomycetes bacterium]
MSDKPWQQHFVSSNERGLELLSTAAQQAVSSIQRPSGPRSSLSPTELHDLIWATDICPNDGTPLVEVLNEFGATVWANSVVPFDPACVAHLHPPTMIPSVVTEMTVAVMNQSMDSWDQAPAATEVELHLTSWIAQLMGMPSTGSGVMTSGGTASNVLGITLARSWAASLIGVDVLKTGLPSQATSWRILCSDQAHFSVQRAAAQLGLGRDSVVTVSSSESGAMDIAALDSVIAEQIASQHSIIAIVGTAGTTDLGVVDPLDAIATRCEQLNAWFHIDAAVAGSYLMSPQLAPRLHGIARADSVTIDFHKLWFQPFNASALIVKDAARFDLLRVKSKYLDRGDEIPGMINLVGRSLDTSRRFDAAKVVVSLRTIGRTAFGDMLHRVVELSEYAAQQIDKSPVLTLLTRPTGPMCVFDAVGCNADDLRQTQQELLMAGDMVLGRTEIKGRAALKFTFMNPLISFDDVDKLISMVESSLQK